MTSVTFELVAERISTVLALPAERLTPDTPLRDLALDSFRMVEMVVDLQEEFQSIFTQDQLQQVHTLGDIFRLLHS
jgi:acyl carrier protein